MASITTILKEASKYSIPTAISAVLSLGLIPVVSRIYPASEYGIINLFYSLGNLLMTFALLGFDNAFIRFFQEPIMGLNNRKAFSLSLFVSSSVILLVTVLICVFMPAGASKYIFGESNTVCLVLLGIYSISLVVFRLLSVVTRQEFDATGYNVQQIGLLLSNRVLFVLAVVVSTSYFPSIILMTLLTSLMALVFLFTRARAYLSVGICNIPREAVRRFAAFALPTMPAAILLWVNSSVAKFVLAGYGRYDEVGVFALAFTIANAFSVLPAAFSVYWSPFVYKHYKDEQKLIRRIQGLLTALAVLLAVIFVATQDVLYLLVGEDYGQSQAYFMIVMLFPIQTLLVETVGYGIYLSNKTYIRLAITGVSALINVVICFLLIPRYGGMGASVALGASALALLLGSFCFGQKYYRSVDNLAKTLILYAVIVLICVGNIAGCSNAGMRNLLVLAGISAVFFTYGKLIFNGVRKRIILRRGSQWK